MDTATDAVIEATGQHVKYMDVNLTAAESFEMLTQIESLPEALITIQKPDSDGTESWMRRGSARTKMYDIHIAGVESVHKLVLNGDGTWYIKTTIAI